MLRLFTHQELMAPDAPTPPPVRAFLQKYIEDFLCKAHPQLGRTGPVCPFMGPALRQNTVYYAIIDDAEITAGKIDAVLSQVCEKFLDLYPSSGTSASYKAVIVLFPNLDVKLAPVLIDGAQQRGKPSFVGKGLMLGEFHALNTTTGLRCPIGSAFFPLQTPVPALAIRSLVSSDIVFLDRPNYAPEIRSSFLQSYHSRFPADPSVAPSTPASTTDIITVISRPPSPTPSPTASPSSASSVKPQASFSNVFAIFALFMFIALLVSYTWLRTEISSVL